MKRRLIIVMLLALTFTSSGLAWLGATEAGLQWAYNLAVPYIPGKLQISSLSGRLIGPVQLDGIRYQLDNQSVEILQASFDWNPIALTAGMLAIEKIYLTDAQIQMVQPETSLGKNAAPVVMPEITLPFAIDLQDFRADDIRIINDDQATRLKSIQTSLSLTHQLLTIHKLVLDSEQLQLKLSGSIEPSPQLSHEIDLEWLARLKPNESIKGKGSLHGNLSRTRLMQNISGAIQLDLNLLLDDPLTQTNWQAEVDLKQVDTSRINENLTPVSGSLRLSAQGNRNSASATGQLEVEQSPYGALSTDFTLERVELNEKGDGIRISQLRLALLQGEVFTSGDFFWQPEPRWRAQISTRSINPVQFNPDWPGRIDSNLKLSGAFSNNALELLIDIDRFEGELRDYPVTMAGKLGWKDNSANIDGLKIVSNNTSLDLDGVVSQLIDVKWTLQSTDLDEIYPDSSGKLNSTGRISGTQDEPLVTAKLDGNDIRVNDINLDKVNASLALELNLQQLDQILTRKIKLQLAGKQIHWRNMIINNLELDADENGFRSTIESPAGNAALVLSGVLKPDGWRGKLDSARLQTRRYGDWRLLAPAPIEILPDRSSLKTLCLQNSEQGKICAALRYDEPDAEIDLDLEVVPLHLIEAWIPPEIEFDSQANVNARLKYSPQRLMGEADVELPGGTVKFLPASGQQHHIEFEQATIRTIASESGLDATLALRLSGSDGIKASANLPAANLLNLDLETQQLQASLQLQLEQLALLEAFLPTLENLQGRLNADIEIDGLAERPRLAGKAVLKNTSLLIPHLNLEISGLNIEASSKAFEQVDYRAQAIIAGGRINLEGNTLLKAASGWQSDIELKGDQIELGRLLQPYLPDKLVVDGTLSTNASLALKPDGRLQARIKLASDSGLLSYPLSETDINQWNYHNIRLDIDVDERGVVATGNLDIDENHLQAGINLPELDLFRINPDTQLLKGSLEISSQDFSLLEALLPEIQQPRGQMQVNLGLSGTLAQPEVLGRADLELSSLTIPRLGINPNQVELQLISNPAGQVTLQGRANSGDGSLTLNGSGQLNADKGWPLNIEINGRNFEVMRTPEAIVNLSPELQISLQHKTADVRGEVTIPYARLRPLDVSSAERVSSDAVILGKDQENQSGWQINSNVRLLLGDRVNLFAYGFDGRLGGNMVIEEMPGQPTRGTGEITIVEGRYRAYGQHLDIEQGRLLFTGGPLNNPGLDIQAVRRTTDVIAGINVTGRLQQPRLDLFSIPSLGQTDTLSYLLTGGPLESASSGEGAMMANAALALGLSGGDQIARSIGDRFGFDEMRVESDSTGDQASLVVGRYLSPRLYIGYGIGLIESINTFNLRYQISDRWQLEAESGTDQGADLFYRFER